MITWTLWHIKLSRDTCLRNFHCLIEEEFIWLCEVLAVEAFLSSFWCVMAHFKQYFRFVSMYLRALVHFASLLNWSLMVMLATLSWSIAYAISKLLSWDTIQSANSCTTPNWHWMRPYVNRHWWCGRISNSAEADQIMPQKSGRSLHGVEAVQRLCHRVNCTLIRWHWAFSSWCMPASWWKVQASEMPQAQPDCDTCDKSTALHLVMGYHTADQESLTMPHMPLTSATWIVT